MIETMQRVALSNTGWTQRAPVPSEYECVCVCVSVIAMMKCVLFLHNGLQLGVDKREAGECRLVHGVYQVLVAVREAGLLAQELPVEVAAVVGGFLGLDESIRQSERRLTIIWLAHGNQTREQSYCLRYGSLKINSVPIRARSHGTFV